MRKYTLHQLAQLGDANAIRDAIGNGADPDELDECGATPLCAAIAERRADISMLLLELGADASVQDIDGSTALHWAVENRLPSVLESLLKKCPDAVSISDKHGNQPLWTAAFNARGNYEMVECLLRFGADPHHRNKVELTPLDIPKRMKEPALLELLESFGRRELKRGHST